MAKFSVLPLTCGDKKRKNSVANDEAVTCAFADAGGEAGVGTSDGFICLVPEPEPRIFCCLVSEPGPRIYLFGSRTRNLGIFLFVFSLFICLMPRKTCNPELRARVGSAGIVG